MNRLEIEALPITPDGRINWKEYFLDLARVNDQFEVPRTMRSGIQRQAQECGFSAQSSTINRHTILITVQKPDSVSKQILAALATLTEHQLTQIYQGCRKANILPPL
jgi:hypothetical protein